MFQSLLDYGRVSLSVILAGLAIKLLDDCLDQHRIDYAPYAMCSICVSVFLWSESLSLYLCSYIVGMFHDERLKLITHFRVYQEQGIVFLISYLLTGLKATFSSILIIFIIQLMDDLMDEKIDKYECKKNWALYFGRIETLLLASILFIICTYIDAFKTLLCLTAALMISFIFDRKDGCSSKDNIIF